MSLDKYEKASQYFQHKAYLMRQSIARGPVEDEHPDQTAIRATYPQYAEDLEMAAEIIDELVAARNYREGAGSPVLTDAERSAMDKVVSILDDLHLTDKKGKLGS